MGNSAVGGYAVRAEDTRAAGSSSSKDLIVIGGTAAGSVVPQEKLRQGQLFVL